jgi:hypothetical protein
MQRRQHGRLADEIGIVTIADGYVVRRDGHATGLIEVTPPDMRVHDAAALERMIAEYEQVLMTLTCRITWYTLSAPPDVQPVVAALRAAQQRAPDMTSYLVLGALADDTQQAAAATTIRLVRWIVAVSTEPPEEPPHGLWADLNPLPPPIRGPKEAVGPQIEGLVQRAAALLRLFGDHTVRILDRAAIRALLTVMFDPIAWETIHGELEPDADRLLQGGGWAPPAAPRAPRPAAAAPGGGGPPWRGAVTPVKEALR